MTLPRDANDRAGLISLAEAANRLALGGDREAFSPLFGRACLAVDLSAGVPLDRGLRDDWAVGLRELACPSIAWLPAGAHAEAAPWASDFDVVVTEERELETVVAACQRNPLAALALVQLLRRSAEGSIHTGLEAESLVYSTLQAGPEFAAWLAARGGAACGPTPSTRLPLRVERSGDGLDLVLDRPEKRNAFSAALRDALAEALQVALADPAVARVRLRAEGPAFCSGGDLDEFGTLPDPATAHAIRSTRNVARLAAACAERLRVELHGACVGAGIELAAFAGRVVARRDAIFQLPEVAMGLVPGAGGTVSLPRRIGRQRTAWMALSGAPVDAETALRWRLVDELGD